MTAPLTSAELEAMEARAAAATPGPWRHTGGGWIALSPTQSERLWLHADFVAAAREDVPRLLAEVRAGRAEIARLRALAPMLPRFAVGQRVRFQHAAGAVLEVDAIGVATACEEARRAIAYLVRWDNPDEGDSDGQSWWCETDLDGLG